MAGLTPEDVQTAIRVVTALGNNLAVFRTRTFKPLRRALHPIVEDMKGAGDAPAGGGKSERSRKRSRFREPGEDLQAQSAEEQLKQRDLELINSRLMRAARLKKLEEMGRDGKDEETPSHNRIERNGNLPPGTGGGSGAVERGGDGIRPHGPDGSALVTILSLIAVGTRYA